MRVKCQLGVEWRGEGEDEGGITEEGQGAVGADETWGGVNGKEERSIGIETRRSEALASVKPMQPIEPLRLAKQAARMSLN